jgi:hypothetical protein
VIFVRLSFSASGLRRVEHRIVQSLDPNPVLDGKLSEQLEMKMRSSWSPQKNFHHFLLSVREVLAVDKKIILIIFSRVVFWIFCVTIIWQNPEIQNLENQCGVWEIFL